MKKLLQGIALLAALLVASTVATAQSTDKSTDLADLTLNDTSGERQSLSLYRGKVVVLNFWATWCIPCREEMPMLVKLQQRYQSQQVQFVGASADTESTQRAISPFARKQKINFPIWTGATTADMQRLGLGEALPATAIIDRDGRIVGRILGPLEKEDLQKRIEWLLGDRQSPAPVALVDNLDKLKRAEGDHHHAEGEENHEHGGVGVEGASTVPS